MEISQKRVVKVTLLLVILAFTQIDSLKSQDFSRHNWYFGGSSNGLIFDHETNEVGKVEGQNPSMGLEGSAVATDPITGNTLFYTDGVNIYDASNQIMLGGGALTGNTNGNQSAAICRVPGSDSLIYVYSNTADGIFAGQINFSIVDVSLAGNNGPNPESPLGQVISSGQPTGITNTSEAMLTLVFGGRNFIIAQDQASNQIVAYEKQFDGSFNVASSLNVPADLVAGNFSFSQAAGKIAIAPQNGSSNVLVLNFDPIGGTLSLDQEIFGSANAAFPGNAVYDTEWSPDGTKLYISNTGSSVGNAAQVHIFDFALPNSPLTDLLPAAVFRSFGLQIGPDEQIYHLYQQNDGDPITLGLIESPNTDPIYMVDICDGEDFNGRQFPSFANPISPALTSVAIDSYGNCAMSPSFFFANADFPVENFNWDLGNGSGPIGAVVAINTYDQGGPVSVSVDAFAGNLNVSDTEGVNIVQTDVMIDLGADTVICPGESLTLDLGDAVVTDIGWSTLETGVRTITVTEAGTYWVAATDPATGCLVYDEIQVDVYGEINQDANVWYFGNGGGIDFSDDTGNVVALTDGALNAPEGVATISDINGDLLFYTDGSTVYNRRHQIMVNGTDIGGDPGSTQSSLIVQVPEQETLFFIFTTEEVYGTGTFRMKFSIVDIKANSADGEVVVKDQLIFGESTERLASVQGDSALWVLSHEYGNNTFRAYQVGSNGVGNPVLSSVGSVHDVGDAGNGQGSMKFSQDGSRVAVAIAPNTVEVFDFDLTTGRLSNPVTLNVPTGNVYGLEFSSNNRFLYASSNGTGGSIFQYDIPADSSAMWLEDNVVGMVVPDAIGTNFGAIQFGADGQMYVAINGSGTLGTITSFNSPVDTARFNVGGFSLNGGTSSFGLPNFIQQVGSNTGEPGATFPENACEGEEIMFSGQESSVIDEFLWSFGDGMTSNEQDAAHTYDNVGSYTATLNITNRCGLDTTFTQVIEIGAPAVLDAIPDDAAICNGTLTLDGGDPANTYSWVDAAGIEVSTDPVIDITDPGIYTVTVTIPLGCSNSKEIFVVDGRPQVDLGPDLSICANEDIADLNAQNVGATYRWFINGTPVGSAAGQMVDTSVPGTYEYIVSVQDPLTNCIGGDTVVFEIGNQITVDATVSATTGCMVADGGIAINIANPDNYSYIWYDPDGNVIQGEIGTSISNLAAGTYGVEVIDRVTGCPSRRNDLTVQDGAASFSIIQADAALPSNCNTESVSVLFILSPDITGTPTYNFFDEDGNNLNTDPLTVIVPNREFVFNGRFGEGQYVLDVTAPNGCFQSTTVVVTLLEELVFAPPFGDISLCGTETTIDVNVNDPSGTPFNNSAVFNWQNVDGSNNFIDSTVGNRATLGGFTGTQTFVVTASDPSGTYCSALDTIAVTLGGDPLINIGFTGDSCDGITTIFPNLSQPNANHSFLWSTGEVSQGITIRQSGDYTLTVRNTDTGCENSVTQPFEVFEPLSVTATSPPSCDESEFLVLRANVVGTVTNYVWFAPNGSQLVGLNADSIRVQIPGTYRIEVRNAACSASASVQAVRFAKTPTTSLLDNAEICPDVSNQNTNEVILSPGIFTTYEWFYNGTSVANTPTLVANAQGTYIFQGTNADQCVSLDTVFVREVCESAVFLPTAFTPAEDGDGLNDNFQAFASYVADFEILIFNRWGELIYQSNDKGFRWDGTVNGKLVKIGTYPYVVRFTSEFRPERGVQQLTGGITVLR